MVRAGWDRFLRREEGPFRPHRAWDSVHGQCRIAWQVTFSIVSVHGLVDLYPIIPMSFRLHRQQPSPMPPARDLPHRPVAGGFDVGNQFHRSPPRDRNRHAAFGRPARELGTSPRFVPVTSTRKSHRPKGCADESLGHTPAEQPATPKRKKVAHSHQTGLKLPIKGRKVAADRVEKASAPPPKPVRKRA